MDVLLLQTKFVKNIVAKMVSKAISKKLGCNVILKINDLEIENSGGIMYIHADVNGEANTKDIAKIVESITKD